MRQPVLMLMMGRREDRAIDAARAYAADWDLECREVHLTKKDYSWWPFRIWFELRIDAGLGSVSVHVNARTGKIHSFEFYPDNPRFFMLPLWAAFPDYPRTTIGWRMGDGEEYAAKWHPWYRTLSDEQKAEYQRMYPPPEDEFLEWDDFYRWLDEPIDGGSVDAEG